MIFSEPPVDAVYDELPAGKDDTVLAVEYLPGQYDQRRFGHAVPADADHEERQPRPHGTGPRFVRQLIR